MVRYRRKLLGVKGLGIPVMLTMHLSDYDIQALYKRLKKMRRKVMEFGLNGRSSILSRKLAILVVKEEMASRGLIADMKRGEK